MYHQIFAYCGPSILITTHTLPFASLRLISQSEFKSDGLYLWELEKLGKYFPSEGDGIINVMFALKEDSKGDINGDARAKYNVLVGDHECILANIRRKPGKIDVMRAYVRAGPREKLHFNPKTVNAAIITCGGLCPGLNNVVREITRALYHLYGIKGTVYGIVGGYKGFYDPAVCPFAPICFLSPPMAMGNFGTLPISGLLPMCYYCVDSSNYPHRRERRKHPSRRRHHPGILSRWIRH